MTLYSKIKALFQRKDYSVKSISNISINHLYGKSKQGIPQSHISQITPIPQTVEEICSFYIPSNPHKHCLEMNNCNGHYLHFCWTSKSSSELKDKILKD